MLLAPEPRQLRDAVLLFRARRLVDHAAALTFFTTLSLVPGLVVVTTILGLVGDEQLVVDVVDRLQARGAPPETVELLRSLLTTVIRGTGDAISLTLGLSVLTGLWGASGAFAAAGRALNVVHDLDEDRSFVRHKLADIWCTLVVVALGVLALAAIGLGALADPAWTPLRWALALLAVAGILAFVTAYAPAGPHRRVRWISPGAVLTIGVAVVATLGLLACASQLMSMGPSYGAFSGAVLLLVWLYVLNLAFLFGAGLDAVRDGRDG